MEVNNVDLSRTSQLLAALKRAKFEVTGEEALAIYQVIAWASTLHDRIKSDLDKPKAEPEKKKKKLEVSSDD